MLCMSMELLFTLFYLLESFVLNVIKTSSSLITDTKKKKKVGLI